MKNKSSVFLALIGSLVLGAAAAHANRTGGDAYPFLKIGLGARAMGMGGAFVSVADDGTAPYWNPAGMGLEANMEKRQAAFMGAFVGQDEFDRSHTYVSLLYPKPPIPWLRNATLGLSLISVGVKDIPHTADDGSGGLLRLGSFNDSQWALGLSYGRSMFLSQGKSMFYVGGGARYIRQTMVGFGSGTGWGVDFGIIGDVNVIFRKQDEAVLRIFHNLKMGVVFHKNFDLKWAGGHADDDPVSGVLGLSFEPIKSTRWQDIIALDFHRTEAQPIWISVGNEFGLKNLGQNSIFLRAGINKFYLQGAGGELTRGELSLDREITYGVGLKIGQLQALKIVADFGFIIGRFESRGRTSLAISF